MEQSDIWKGSSVNLFFVQNMRQPKHVHHHAFTLPPGLTLQEATPIAHRAFADYGAQFFIPPPPCAACSGPFAGRSESYLLVADPPEGPVTKLTMLAWIIPWCDKTECIQKCERLRALLPEDFSRMMQQGKRTDNGLPYNPMIASGKADVRLCNYCHRFQAPGEPKFLLCGLCREVYYCSKRCQMLSWDGIHSRSCRRTAAPTSAERNEQVMDTTPAVITFHVFPSGSMDTGVKMTMYHQAPLTKREAANLATTRSPSPRFATWIEWLMKTSEQEMMDAYMARGTRPLCVQCKTVLTDVRWCQCTAISAIAEGISIIGTLVTVCSRDQCTVATDRALAELFKPARDVGSAISDCFVCHTWPPIGKPFMRCSRCKTRSYCSIECQRKNWPEHKAACVVASAATEHMSDVD